MVRQKLRDKSLCDVTSCFHRGGLHGPCRLRVRRIALNAQTCTINGTYVTVLLNFGYCIIFKNVYDSKALYNY